MVSKTKSKNSSIKPKSKKEVTNSISKTDLNKFYNEAQVWNKERNGVRCNLCAFKCFIAKDKAGICGVRKNFNNKLYTSNKNVKAMVVDNVERRPLFHFLPGAKSLSISGDSNSEWKIEHDRLPRITKKFTMEQTVKEAENKKAEVISYTYNEPTLFFEYIKQTARYAHRSSIKNVFSTNGIINTDAIKIIAKYIDAVVINFKASGDPNFMANHHLLKNTDPIFAAIKQLRKQRVHVEITNTIIPQIGDDVQKCRELAERVVADVDPTVPFHLLQFHPNNEFSDLPFTSTSKLEECFDMVERAGIRYAYIGNTIEPHKNENTFCFNCREMVMQRISGNLKSNILDKDRCPHCGVRMDVVL